MFENVGDAIDYYEMLSKDVSEIEATLKTLRGYNFEDDIEHDKRKPVMVLYAERKKCLDSISKIKAMKVRSE